MKVTQTLRNPQQAHAVWCDLWTQIKGETLQGNRLEVTVKPERRNGEQNRKLHACIQDIAGQVDWAGQRWDVETWKRLLTAAWMRTRNEAAVLVPAIDGHGFDVLYRRTSELDKAECADLIEYLLAWGTENGVTFSEQA